MMKDLLGEKLLFDRLPAQQSWSGLGRSHFAGGDSDAGRQAVTCPRQQRHLVAPLSEGRSDCRAGALVSADVPSGAERPASGPA